MRLEARNFAVIFIFISFTTYEKTSRPEFYEWLLGPEKFSELSRNGHQVIDFLGLPNTQKMQIQKAVKILNKNLLTRHSNVNDSATSMVNLNASPPTSSTE